MGVIFRQPAIPTYTCSLLLEIPVIFTSIHPEPSTLSGMSHTLSTTVVSENDYLNDTLMKYDLLCQIQATSVIGSKVGEALDL